MIAAVKAHAWKNYEKDGWDSIVECYDDNDILRDMGDATTVEEAIQNVSKHTGFWLDYRQGVLNELF